MVITSETIVDKGGGYSKLAQNRALQECKIKPSNSIAWHGRFLHILSSFISSLCCSWKPPS